jgi:hypothetical protein
VASSILKDRCDGLLDQGALADREASMTIKLRP